MQLTLDHVRACLQGAVPATIATCDAAGVPNVSYVSQIHHVDSDHIALSFQFFNKTRQNMQQNPQITAYLIDPVTTARYRLAMLYVRTETEGALFQSMKARLASIASHTGMGDVFVLKGADICRVLHIEQIDCEVGPPSATPLPWTSLLRRLCEQVQQHCDLSQLLDSALASLCGLTGVRQAMILIADEAAQKLYTLASSGYSESGVGAEVPYDCGVIGVAARYRTPILISHMSAEYLYSEATRAALVDPQLETGIPFPGLTAPQSQLAIPLLTGAALVGVLFLESERELAFDYHYEDALMVFGMQLAQQIAQLQQQEQGESTQLIQAITPDTSLPPLQVRYFAGNHSVFVDDVYLIKGVAGSILWRLLTLMQEQQRVEFSNRELRLDGSLGLPDIDDNLEARLILLRRRLAEQCPDLQLRKTGRGRFQLVLQRPVRLVADSPG
ncbi:MAG: GAF domain-containing protein [Pseudomonadaceae bacterium]